MIEIVIAVMAALIPVLYTIIVLKFGAYIERRRISSALRQLPISSEDLKFYLDRLDLDVNLIDRRGLGDKP